MKAIHVIGVIFAGLFALVVIAVLATIGTYNGLNAYNQLVDAKWGDVQGAYQRRYDLIPNLVETVKGAANFEKETLTAITQARASVGQIKLDQAPTDPKDVERFAMAQQGLGTALSRLLVVSEKYPELKSTTHFRDLQAQIEGTENRINVARHEYNEAVRMLNTSIGSFPGKFVAGFGPFVPKTYFKVESEEAAKAPKVNFSSK
jgi:LemA protein